MKKILPALLIGLGVLIPATVYAAAFGRKEKYIKEYVKRELGENSVVYKLIPYIIQVSNDYGIPPELTLSIIIQESHGNPNAVSATGAIGLMQIQPSTAQKICGFPTNWLFDPKKNILCGVKYLSYLKNKADMITDIIAGYYAGEKAIEYRRRTGVYPSYGYPPVHKYVSSVYNRYIKIRGISV